MRIGWFNISWYLYASVCLIVAVGYMMFAIEPTKGYNWSAQPIWRVLILRWFHSLVWVLLGLACLILQWKGDQGIGWAKAISLIGLLLYVIYLVCLFVEKGKQAA